MAEQSATHQPSILKNKEIASEQVHLRSLDAKPRAIPPRRRTTARRAAYILVTLGLLIGVDQLTKALAFGFAPSAQTHIHQANAYSLYTALAAMGLIAVAWTLPINFFTKMMWVAAALSNHFEMLIRPGTMDFIAFKFSGNVLVANVADIYFMLGVLAVAHEMAQRIRQAPSWTSPVVERMTL